MNKKFLVFGANQFSSTDGVILLGIEKIIHNIYKDSVIKYLDKNLSYKRDLSVLTNEDLCCNEKFDAIIIPGSPFIWHYFHYSDKIKNLIKLKEIHQCPVICLGIGECLPLDNRTLLYDESHLNAITEIYSNDLVIVRSKLCKKIFDKAKIESIFLPCPSYFCYNNSTKFHKTKEHLMVWYEPTVGLSHTYQEMENRIERYYNRYLDYFDTYNPDVVCVNQEEIDFALKIGLPKPRLLKNAYDTLNTVKEYQEVFTGRVHIGVPAKVSNSYVDIVPIDTRYSTIIDIENFEYEKSFNDYKNLIRDFLNF